MNDREIFYIVPPEDRRLLHDFNDLSEAFAAQEVSTLAYDVAAVLWSAGVVKINTKRPKKISCGIKVPIYFNNRVIIGVPEAYRALQDQMRHLIEELGLDFDVIVGVPTGGIPHSIGLAWTLLNDLLPIPSAYVPVSTKPYGDPQAIVGADITNKRVLLIEDHVSTGSAALEAAKKVLPLAHIVACVSITEHGLPEARAGFAELGVPYHPLTTPKAIIKYGMDHGLISPPDLEVLYDFYADPRSWEFRSGHNQVVTMGTVGLAPEGVVRPLTYITDFM